MSRERVFSGIQPSGDIHIGNYLGAIKNWVQMLDQYECIFCIVDLHAMTIKYDPEEMRRRVINATMDNISCGLDPDRCVMFVQSEVPEHTELTWILGTVTAMGELSRMTQFKEKSRQQELNINSGLFTYPILMAADILLYKATVVPVGEDQIQHLELAREIARHFSNRFAPYFPEPQAHLTEAKRIMGIDGKNKMSKSLDNHIALNMKEDEVRKRIMSAVTDESRLRRTDPGHPEICNICNLHKYFSPPETVENITEGCRKATIGCVDCKKMLIPNIMKVLTPIQDKRAELEQNMDYVHQVLDQGAAFCSNIAKQTMEEVKDICGILRRR